MAPTDPPPSDKEETTKEWELDSRYRLVRVLGTGGMGEVLLAEDRFLSRLVAIKSVRADLCQDQELRRRIERECLLHAKVGTHPHIVTLFDKYEVGGSINLVMEYVEGETLQDLFQRNMRETGGMRLAQALDIVAQTLEALSRIHAHGIVHRDIKPANIILQRDESGGLCAKLMDFGIARVVEGSDGLSQLTTTGLRGPGTPLYMAPEQIDPTYGEITPATDVYAVGVMLYQMIAGKPPFGGGIATIFNGHLNTPPPPLNDLLPPAAVGLVGRLVARALAKQPADRFPTARAFRDEILAIGPLALAETLPGATVRSGSDPGATAVVAAPAAPAVTPPAGRPRSSKALVLSAIGMFALASAAVGYWYLNGRPPRQVVSAAPLTDRVNQREGVVARPTPEPTVKPDSAKAEPQRSSVGEPMQQAAPLPESPTQSRPTPAGSKLAPEPTPDRFSPPERTATPAPPKENVTPPAAAWIAAPPTSSPTLNARVALVSAVIDGTTSPATKSKSIESVNPLGAGAHLLVRANRAKATPSPKVVPTPAPTAKPGPTSTPTPKVTPSPTPTPDTSFMRTARADAESSRADFLKLRVAGRDNERNPNFKAGEAELEKARAAERRGELAEARNDYGKAAALYRRAIQDFSSNGSGFAIR